MLPFYHLYKTIFLMCRNQRLFFLFNARYENFRRSLEHDDFHYVVPSLFMALFSVVLITQKEHYK